MSALDSSGVSPFFSVLTSVVGLLPICALATGAFFIRRPLPPVFLVADFRGRRSILTPTTVSTRSRAAQPTASIDASRRRLRLPAVCICAINRWGHAQMREQAAGTVLVVVLRPRLVGESPAPPTRGPRRGRRHVQPRRPARALRALKKHAPMPPHAVRAYLESDRERPLTKCPGHSAVLAGRDRLRAAQRGTCRCPRRATPPNIP